MHEPPAPPLTLASRCAGLSERGQVATVLSSALWHGGLSKPWPWRSWQVVPVVRCADACSIWAPRSNASAGSSGALVGHLLRPKMPSGGGASYAEARDGPDERSLHAHAHMPAGSLLPTDKGDSPGSPLRAAKHTAGLDSIGPSSPGMHGAGAGQTQGPGARHGSTSGVLGSITGGPKESAHGRQGRGDKGMGGRLGRGKRLGNLPVRRALTHGSPAGPRSSCSSSATSSVYSGTASPRVTMSGRDGELAERVGRHVMCTVLGLGLQGQDASTCRLGNRRAQFNLPTSSMRAAALPKSMPRAALLSFGLSGTHHRDCARSSRSARLLNLAGPAVSTFYYGIWLSPKLQPSYLHPNVPAVSFAACRAGCTTCCTRCSTGPHQPAMA